MRMRRIAFAAVGFALAVGSWAAGAPAQAPQNRFSPAQTEAIEAIVRDYLLRHPELLLELMDKLDKQREDESRDRVQATLRERRDELFNDPDSVVLGGAGGDVTIIEFFDYRCPYCKQMAEPVTKLLKEDRKLRLVLKEFPILGPDSVIASRAAIAARAQGKYVELHDALMAAKGTLDEATVLQIAGKTGLDTRRLKTDMASPQVERIIERNKALAQALQINGTPSFVIGTTIIPGAIEPETLKRMIAELRKGG
jgi:protein-disulfide isomerase